MTLLHSRAGYLNGGRTITMPAAAWTPIVNVIGDHAVPHQRYDAARRFRYQGMARTESCGSSPPTW